MITMSPLNLNQIKDAHPKNSVPSKKSLNLLNKTTQICYSQL